MKKIFKNIIYILVVMIAFTATSCKQNEQIITTPEDKAHFTFVQGGSFSVLPTSLTYKVPVGVTTVANVDRTVAFTVTSPTGAVAGTHYTINKTVATIKAGQATDTIIVTGILPPYAAGRKDSLTFTINDPSLKAFPTNSTYKLYMRGPCFEGDTDLAALNGLKGSYANTNEVFGTGPYGPYTTTISAVTLTSPTTGTITVTNIWDNGWGPITFNLDWTNPAATTTAVVPQAAIPGSNAGDLNATYAGQTIAVRALATNPTGTFKACTSEFVLRMQLGVTGVGFFGSLYTVTLKR
jgi:hypothetical protein